MTDSRAEITQNTNDITSQRSSNAQVRNLREVLVNQNAKCNYGQDRSLPTALVGLQRLRD